jgi:hypothetical protein
MAQKSGERFHRYEECTDDCCPLFGCRAYKKGFDDGYGAGHAAGYADGHTDGYAEGYGDGSADGYAAGSSDAGGE